MEGTGHPVTGVVAVTTGAVEQRLGSIQGVWRCP